VLASLFGKKKKKKFVYHYSDKLGVVYAYIFFSEFFCFLITKSHRILQTLVLEGRNWWVSFMILCSFVAYVGVFLLHVFSVFCFYFEFCFVRFVLAFGLRTNIFILTFGSRVRSMCEISLTAEK
jgi:hypothetical protein